ncbi:hypothetical protein AYO20_09508 [Fonsecaea nubica]|uniref:Uncharacterized protein n=1 Tax=Fonsecaea nubica TaxID=856822 RepID=A0A178CDZ1_9EURO|nr:hypothetical protein AYO20_09508 [Fonsecaea nubica]OAL28180.1 hypothetical protein AYO20_09508 [Fonsecaea nubica]
MTTAPYLGAALCYDASRVGRYKSACLAVNEIGNAWQIHGREFDCTGILMHNFYLALVDAGEVNQCVCKFENTGTEWAFAGHWGPCNGACVGKYVCNGNKPVVVSDSVVERATPSNATSSTPSSSTSLAAPLTVGWKMMVLVATAWLFSGIA